MKRWKKWIAFGLAFVVALVMGGTINSTPIASRAVVVGVAIDKSDDLLELTAQILVSTGATAGKPQAKEVSAKAKTVSAALSQIAENTSMIVSMAHCNLVVLGREILEENAVYPLDYLIRNAYLSENALLIGTLGKASEILKTKVAFSELASLYAQRAVESLTDFDSVAERTIKEFVVDEKKFNKSNYLMVIERVPLETVDVVQTAGGDDSQGGGGGNGGSDKEQEFYFNLRETALFYDSKMVGVLDETETVGLNLVEKEVKAGTLHIKGDNDEEIEVYIVNASTEKEFDKETRTMKVNIEMKVNVKEINASHSILPRADGVLTETELKRGEETLINSVTACYEKAKSLGVDVFNITSALYRRYQTTDFSVANTAIEVKSKIIVEE